MRTAAKISNSIRQANKEYAHISSLIHRLVLSNKPKRIKIYPPEKTKYWLKKYQRFGLSVEQKGDDILIISKPTWEKQ